VRRDHHLGELKELRNSALIRLHPPGRPPAAQIYRHRSGSPPPQRGADVAWVTLVVLDLAAQVADFDTEIAPLVGTLWPLHGREQLPAGDGSPLVPDKPHQQV